jgi:hypothetical protein
MSEFWSALRQRRCPSVQSGATAPHSMTLARLTEGRVKTANLWSALRQQRCLQKALPVRPRLKLIKDADTVDLEPIDAFDLCGGSGTLEPCRRAPGILVCNRHQAMFYRILMNIIQPSEVRLFISQARVPEVMPDTSAWLTVEPIHPTGRFGVEPAEHEREAFCCRYSDRRVSNEMIVIGKHRPSFELPTIFLCQFEQPSLKDSQPPGTTEVLSFKVRSGRNEVDTRLGEPMCRGMRPRVAVLDHEEKVADQMDLGKRGKARCRVESVANAHPAESASLWSALRQQRFSPSVQSGALAPHCKRLAPLVECQVEAAKFWSALRQRRCPSLESGAVAPHSKRLSCFQSLLLFFAVFFCLFSKVQAHELRPAYLELREETPGEFSVLWKTPMRGELRLALEPAFTGRTAIITPRDTRHTKDAAVQTWRLRAVEPPEGQTVQIRGLEGTMTDVLVRIEFADGSAWVRRLTPQEPAASVPERQSGWSVAGGYLKLGVGHILLGIDRLLFVLALLLVTQGRNESGADAPQSKLWGNFKAVSHARKRFGVRRATALFSRAALKPYLPLVKTVTAFTVAHSLTLGLSALGFVHVPSAPVEAVIALSIVFVAAELVYARQGQLGITAKSPWVVAFTCGLLHGFGFAGALSEVGLPQGHIPVALPFFNLGVEAGQLLFILAILSLMVLTARLWSALRQQRFSPLLQSGALAPHSKILADLAPAYAIGSVAMFWVLQRLSTF